jgi:hypothetical protein
LSGLSIAALGPTRREPNPGGILMSKNMSGMDRTLRILIALGIVVLWQMGAIGGVLAVVLGIVAVAFVLTALIGWCPLYTPFRISTRRPAAGGP